MGKPRYFKFRYGSVPLPIFFPDATRGFIRSLDSVDIENTKTKGVLVNTYHLMKEVGSGTVKKFGGVGKFMNWSGALISDSGGFQIGSLVKKNPSLGRVTDKGVYFKFPGEKTVFITPESSIDFQMDLETDMVVTLDDFDSPGATKSQAKDSVRRTILWAERSKKEYERICKSKKIPKEKRPYLLGVIQGGRDKLLRRNCIHELLKIGFDGLGYGGEEKVKGKINLDLAKYIAEYIPGEYFLYALGVGKPHDIVNMTRLGWDIFDCVLPTRDARHKRLYIYNFPDIDSIDVTKPDFYSYFIPDKKIYQEDTKPVSKACDCLLCTNYSRGFLYHLFKTEDAGAFRLATIHNLRFYSILMELLRN